MITQERKLAEVTINITDDPITQDQREQIAHGIGEIRRFLIEDRDQQKQTVEFIMDKLNYLESSAKRISRKDWLHTAIGILFIIAIGIALPPNEARDLFSLATNAFADVFTKLLP